MFGLEGRKDCFAIESFEASGRAKKEEAREKISVSVKERGALMR